MRTLATLSVLQTVGLLVLIVHSFNGTDPPAERGGQVSHVAESVPPPTVARVDHIALLADEQRLRKIVREELARAQSLPDQKARAAKPAAVARSVDDAALRDARALVEQKIATYQSVGSISQEQMFALQVAIAKLDAASRKQMMSRLVRAMNAGQIKGNF